MGNFVLMEYGTGAIMAVPAHDQRDFEFAREFSLPIIVTITPEGSPLDPASMEGAYEGDGVMVNSGPFNGANNRDAIPAIIDYLEERIWARGRSTSGSRTGAYRDSATGDADPDDLLRRLRRGARALRGPAGGAASRRSKSRWWARSPLADYPAFYNVKCPSCGKAARRETDTMDTFVESSWYFLKYASPHYDQAPSTGSKVDYWTARGPVYRRGGARRAPSPLFQVLQQGHQRTGIRGRREPFENLLTQGMVIKDGSKMSKSKGNVVDPDYLIELRRGHGPAFLPFRRASRERPGLERQRRGRLLPLSPEALATRRWNGSRS